MDGSDEQRARFLAEVERSNQTTRRVRGVVVGLKLGVLASVPLGLFLPRSVSVWAIVITGAALGAVAGFFVTRPER